MTPLYTAIHENKINIFEFLITIDPSLMTEKIQIGSITTTPIIEIVKSNNVALAEHIFRNSSKEQIINYLSINSPNAGPIHDISHAPIVFAKGQMKKLLLDLHRRYLPIQIFYENTSPKNYETFIALLENGAIPTLSNLKTLLTERDYRLVIAILKNKMMLLFLMPV